jgi:hypothetical protein
MKASPPRFLLGSYNALFTSAHTHTASAHTDLPPHQHKDVALALTSQGNETLTELKRADHDV